MLYCLSPWNNTGQLCGNILVPFAVESALSGVAKTVGKQRVVVWKIFYGSCFLSQDNVLLHFGAVTALRGICKWVIRLVHTWWLWSFSFDITAALTKSGPQKLAVRVWILQMMPSTRGKQIIVLRVSVHTGYQEYGKLFG